MSDNTSSKDWWDKLDIAASVASSVVLVIIGFVLQKGSERIAHSLQSGELVQRLIADLSAPDTTIRHGIALVALDRSLGSHNPEMLSDICVQILENREFDQPTGRLAFEILKRRNSSRAREIVKEAQRELGKSREELYTSSDQLPGIEQPNMSDSIGPEPAEQPRQVNLSSQARKVLSNVVFLQFRGEENVEVAKQLQNHLHSKGFNMPPIERVDEDYPNSVRYFHEADELLADSVVQVANAFFDQKGRSVDLKTQSIPGYASQVPRGQLEVWVNLKRTQ